jgi:hypothetical protein
MAQERKARKSVDSLKDMLTSKRQLGSGLKWRIAKYGLTPIG